VLVCCRAPAPSVMAQVAPLTALRHQQQTAGRVAALLMVRRGMRQRRHPGHSAGGQRGTAELWLQLQQLVQQCRLPCIAQMWATGVHCKLLSQSSSGSTVAHASAHLSMVSHHDHRTRCTRCLCLWTWHGGLRQLGWDVLPNWQEL
jgi:hypothetical protein